LRFLDLDDFSNNNFLLNEKSEIDFGRKNVDLCGGVKLGRGEGGFSG
jgi:hypothetical protein